MAEAEVVQGTNVTFQRQGQYIDKFVPKSTEHLVIVPSNIKGTGFLKNLYAKNRSFLSGLISKVEYNEIVERAAK